MPLPIKRTSWLEFDIHAGILCNHFFSFFIRNLPTFIPKDILDHAKKGTNGSRYTCVNLQNDSTIEFRIFRGTLKYNTLIATLQLVERICDVAIFLSDEELKAMSWTTFVSGCQAPELMQYLKERRLYVNEPVAGEEEL